MFQQDIISLVSGFLLFCLFLMGAWALHHFVGKYGRLFQKSRYMQVVDHIQVSQDRQLFILRLEKENRCLLVASGPEGMRLITELQEDYEGENPLGNGESFLSVFQKEGAKLLQKKLQGKVEAKNAADAWNGEGEKASSSFTDSEV